ncbi:hypothetical protein PENSPDRAFT_655042 [Peniophora sp. CONT]|nr:hypothetical protein PENSPDRAFT_655042 [Peniophora sp. CONT]
MVVLLYILPFLLAAVALAQGITTPSGWNTTTYLTRTEREALANAAAARLVPQIDTVTGRIDSLGFSSQDVNLAAVLALQDYHSGNTTYQDLLGHMFSAYYAGHNNSFLAALPHGNNEDIQWGLSAYYAYRAYQDETFYNFAKDAWERVYSYLVDTGDAQTGTQSTRSVDFKTACPSAKAIGNDSNIGAVFMYPDTKNDTTVNSQTMGPFMTLGAYLYESSNHTSQYLVYANLTGQYLKHHLYNGTIMLDTANLATCAVDSVTAFTYNTGYALEGIAILANQNLSSLAGTDDGLGMYRDWLDTMVPQAIQFVGWTGANGIIFEENADPDNWTSGLKAVLIRGLLEARARNPTANWAPLVDDFITVQYNALLLSTAAGGNDTYSTNWLTVSNGTVDYPGSITALDVLNAAIIIPTDATSGSSPVKSGGTNAGAIVGGVIGGLVALSLIALALILIRRRRNRHIPSSRAFLDGTGRPRQSMIQPFVATRGPTSTAPTGTSDPYSFYPPGTHELHSNGTPNSFGAAAMHPKLQRMQQSYTASDTPTRQVPPSTNPPSSAAPTSPTSDERTLSPSEISSLLRRLNGILGRSPVSALPPDVHALETDAYEGAPPPDYHDAAGQR